MHNKESYIAMIHFEGYTLLIKVGLSFKTIDEECDN